jgi:hypothetical protein
MPKGIWTKLCHYRAHDFRRALGDVSDTHAEAGLARSSRNKLLVPAIAIHAASMVVSGINLA